MHVRLAIRTVSMLAVAAVLGTALAGCSVSDKEIDDTLADLPGVVAADGSCHEFSCSVDVEVSDQASAAQITTILGEARTIDNAAEVSLRLGGAEDPGSSLSAELSVEHSPRAGDEAVGQLLAFGAAHPEVTRLRVTSGRASGVEVAVADGDSIWPLAEQAWDLTQGLEDPTMEMLRAFPERQQQLVITGSTFPKDLIAVAIDLEAKHADSGLTGVAVLTDRLVAGLADQDLARTLRSTLAEDPRTAGATVEALATGNVIGAAQDDAGAAAALDPLVDTLDEHPEVLSVQLEPSSVLAQVPDLGAAKRALKAVRAGAASFEGSTLRFSARPGRQTVEILQHGDDAVLDLATLLLAGAPGADLELEQRLEREPTVWISLSRVQPGPGTGSAPPLAPEVLRVARVLAGTPGSAPTYGVSVKLTDADGRSASASWEVARNGQGWTLGEIRGTAETAAMVRRQWTKATR